MSVDQKFKLKNFYSSIFNIWLILILVTLIFLYAHLYSIPSEEIEGSNEIYFFFLIVILLITKIGEVILRHKSYLEIKGGNITLVIFNRKKWSIPINSIESVDRVQGHFSARVNTITTDVMSKFIGFSIMANNKLYPVKPHLENFDEFKLKLLSINPSIKLEDVTKADTLEDLKRPIAKMSFSKLIFMGVLVFIGIIVTTFIVLGSMA